ncbi:MAG: hypothetical protein J6S91_06420 [Treponema sp.]|nr:hypothetical protein [Treponema sp.]
MKALFSRTCLKRIITSLFICLNMVMMVHAGDWVLAAREFDFAQKGSHSQAEETLRKAFPTLILEQLNTEAQRIPPLDEVKAREYERLLQERQSLFLELSAAVKRRDSVLVQESGERAVKKQIVAEEKKIQEIQKKIQDNLDLSMEYMPAPLKADEKASDKKNAETILGSEKLAVYKGDSSSLYLPSEEVLKEGFKSRRYEKSVIDSKINALISGSITIYGNYLSVSADLTLYPGAKAIASVMEVGSMDDVARLSRAIAQKLLPVIVNTTGTVLHFEIEPAELASKARVTVDGLPVKLDSPVIVPASTHTVEIQCPGYISQTVTYLFQDSPHFVLHVPLKEQSEGYFSLSLKDPVQGQLFFNSESVGDGLDGASVKINGRNIIGQLKAEEGNSFFIIPPSLQTPENKLVVPAMPSDLNAEIEKRRIWSYRGYTALILSLPFTFFSLGNYNSAVNAYMSASLPYEEVQKWNTLKWTSLSITAVAAGFFIFELVRYLCTANKALPASAREAKAGELEAINEKVFKIKNEAAAESAVTDPSTQEEAEEKE